MTEQYRHLLDTVGSVLTAREAHIRAVKRSDTAGEELEAARLEIALDNLLHVERVCRYIDGLAPGEISAIRQWARNGYEAGLPDDPGVVPYGVAAAYRAAQAPRFVRGRR